MDLDRVLLELRARLDLLDATILSIERLGELHHGRQRQRGVGATMEPARRHREEPRSKPQKAMAARAESPRDPRNLA